MSQIFFGSLQFNLVAIRRFEDEAVYTPDGMDYQYTKINIDADLILAFDLNPQVGQTRQSIGGPARIPGTFRNLVRRALLPRQRLVVSLSNSSSDNVILDVAAPDAIGGPFGRVVSVNAVVGQKCLHCRVRFETAVYDCDHDSGDDRPVFSNRWSMRMSYDQNFYCTRVISGQLRANPKFIAGLAGQGLERPGADALRERVFRGLPNGFQAVSADFTQSSDGLTLDYNIVDQEKYLVAPNPATTWAGSYTESSDNGIATHADIEVSCAGPKDASKRVLLQRAALIALSRVQFGQPPAQGRPPTGDFIVSSHIHESLHENAVSVKLRVNKTTRLQNPLGRPIPFNNEIFGRIIPRTKMKQDGTLVIDPAAVQPGDRLIDAPAKALPVYGTALLQAFMAAWQVDPCTATASSSPSSSGTVPTNPDEPAGPITRSSGEDFLLSKDGDWEDPQLSESNQQYAYLDYDIKVTYHTDAGQIQLPRAETPSQGDSDFPPSQGAALPTSAIVQAGQPISTKLVTFVASRVNVWPELPRRDPPDGQTLLRREIIVTTPRLAADMTSYICTVSGYYLYAVDAAIDELEDALLTAHLPYDLATPESNRLEPENWKDGILDTEDAA